MRRYAAWIALALLGSAAPAGAQSYNANLAGPGVASDDLGCHFGSLRGRKFPSQIYDATHHDRITYNVSRCTGGYFIGLNEDTGKTWNVDIDDTGAMNGKDLSGAKWRFDPKTRLFTVLASGKTCGKTDYRYVCPDAEAVSGGDQQR